MTSPNYEPVFLDNFQVACGAISVFSSIEILCLAFSTFHRYNTLYFWAICGCAMGCIFFAAGFLDLFYKLYLVDGSTIYRPLFVLTFGWYGMVTGFALVLWSRLHIVMVPKKYIRLLKFLIIYNIIFSHFPTTVLTFGDSIVGTEPWVYGYSVMEKIQMTSFCFQEVLMSAMYLHFTRKLTVEKKNTPVVRQTLYLNTLVLCLDLVMLLLEYIGLYEIQIMLKVVIYAVKLKLEFFILTLLTRSLQKNNYTHESKNQRTKEVANVNPGSTHLPSSKT